MRIRFSTLNLDEQEAIHHAALQVLERVGVRVHNLQLLGILNQADASIGSSNETVCFPQQMVSEALTAAPKRWDLMDQLGNRLPLPAPEPRFVARLLLPQILDHGERQPRPPSTQDIVDHCRLANALPEAHIVYKTDCACIDVPDELTYLTTIATVFKNTTKHCLANPINPDATRYWVEMSEAASGRAIDEHPGVLCGIPVTSPLQIDSDSAESLIYLANKGAPVNCMTMPNAGLSAPLTLAGSLVQHTAETLALITAVQLINPGTPVCFGGTPCITNMKTGNIIMGSPALPLFSNALATMARYYGLSGYTVATYTDAVVPEVQCGIEKAFAALSGMATYSDIGMLGGDLGAATVLSQDQLLIDYEIWEACSRVVKGIAVDSTTLANEVIERVGPGGLYLTDVHTLSWLRQREHFVGQLFNHIGSRDAKDAMLEKAHTRAQMILAQEPERPVSTAVVEHIDAYVADESQRI